MHTGYSIFGGSVVTEDAARPVSIGPAYKKAMQGFGAAPHPYHPGGVAPITAHQGQRLPIHGQFPVQAGVDIFGSVVRPEADAAHATPVMKKMHGMLVQPSAVVPVKGMRQQPGAAGSGIFGAHAGVFGGFGSPDGLG